MISLRAGCPQNGYKKTRLACFGKSCEGFWLCYKACNLLLHELPDLEESLMFSVFLRHNANLF